MKKFLTITMLLLMACVCMPEAMAQKKSKAHAKKTTAVSTAKSPLFDILFSKSYGAWSLRDGDVIFNKLSATDYKLISTKATTITVGTDEEEEGDNDVDAKEYTFTKDNTKIILAVTDVCPSCSEVKLKFANNAAMNQFIAACKAKGAKNGYSKGSYNFGSNSLISIWTEGLTVNIAMAP